MGWDSTRCGGYAPSQRKLVADVRINRWKIEVDDDAAAAARRLPPDEAASTEVSVVRRS